jgi:hypothetical protein
MITQERATEIFNQAVKQAKIGPWSDELRRIMTPDEIKAVYDQWQTMPGNTCFVDSFLRFKNQPTKDNHASQ